MKKVIKFLSFAMIMVMVVPMIATAASVQIDGSCEKIIPCTTGKCQSTCKLNIKGYSSSLNSLEMNLQTQSGVTIKNVELVDKTNWIVTNTGSTYTFAPIGTLTSTDFQLATVILEYDSSVADCSLIASVNGGTTVTIKTETTTTTKTGAELPIAILTLGVGLSAVIYLTVRKNTKLYKI